jgi:predicted ATPase
MSSFNIKDHLQYRIKNHKCFTGEPQGFICINPINVIIGKNNSGKSALLDLIERSEQNGFTENRELCIELTPSILKEILELFPDLRPSFNHIIVQSNKRVNSLEVINNVIQSTRSEIRWTSSKGDVLTVFQDTEMFKKLASQNLNSPLEHLAKLVHQKLKPFNYQYFGLSAERDVRPEFTNQDLSIVEYQKNGSWTTRLLDAYLNRLDYDENVIDTLRSRFNEILVQDESILDILVQKLPAGQSVFRSEIIFKFENRGRIKLSDTGSGLKTILLVLAMMEVLPVFPERRDGADKSSEFWFGIEEPENNLHPSVLRNLLAYISKKVKDKGYKVFITTHSNIVIDAFANDPDAQILKVENTSEGAKVTTLTTRREHGQLLSELDYRASDLLQANCVVWVEGPTDRMYFNKWIELYTDSKLKEGLHYQCMFYGGRLLSHLSLTEEQEKELDDLINLLKVNRHAIILIDSDKSKEKDELNKTKKRVIAETKQVEGFAWVTKGRFIENYIPVKTLKSLNPQLNPRSKWKYAKFENYSKVLGNGPRLEKVDFAKRVIPKLLLEDLEGHLDWKKRMEEIVAKIREWNGGLV